MSNFLEDTNKYVHKALQFSELSEDQQEVALSKDEFIVPADVVAGLGNGSSNAGASKLYEMMDRVRMARTGKKTQPPEIEAEEFMPA